MKSEVAAKIVCFVCMLLLFEPWISIYCSHNTAEKTLGMFNFRAMNIHGNLNVKWIDVTTKVILNIIFSYATHISHFPNFTFNFGDCMSTANRPSHESY